MKQTLFRASRTDTARILVILFLVLLAAPCYADVASSLAGIKNALTRTVLPVIAVCGMAIAAMSFFTGNPNAKQHILYAIIGCMFGFGAQAIVDLIKATVN